MAPLRNMFPNLVKWQLFGIIPSPHSSFPLFPLSWMAFREKKKL